MSPPTELLEELGRGAHSVVHRVRLRGAEYAMKVLDTSTADAADALVAFRREAALLARVDHPGLPRVHDVGETAGRPYLVMDLVRGRPLSRLLADGPLPEERAVAIGAGLAGALAALHRVGLVHRDVKPQNVVVGDEGEARLVDFGLAVRGDDGDGTAAVGTLAYTAPEQSRMIKRAVDGRADLYSLGVVLFECVTGVPPFASPDVGELLRMHAVTPPPDPRSLAPRLSDALAAVIATLLAKDPDDRYASAAGLAADLHRLAAGPGPAFRPARHDPPGAAPGDVPLCGRDAELERLAGRWHRARGGDGGVGTVRGAAGIGKSRLVRELAALVRHEGGLVLAAAAEDGDATPLGPLRRAVDAHVRAAAELPEPARGEAHRRLGAAAGPAAGLLGALSPALAGLLGVPAPPGTERPDQFVVAVAGFLGDLARQHDGLLLQLDDVQWLDPGTRRVLRLCEHGDPPLLAVLTERGDGPAAPDDLALQPLGADAVAELVAAELPGVGHGSRPTELLAARAHGNPFVVLEYVRAVVDAGLLVPSWGGWQLDADALDALELPRDAETLLLSRLGELDPPVLDVLTVAAAAGHRFRAGPVAAAAGLDPQAVADLLGEDGCRRVVEPREGGGYAFLHERVREALLAGLPAAALAALHVRCADALAAEPEPDVYEVGHHRLLAGSAAPAGPAAAACAAAGRIALAEHAAEEAVAFLGHAVARAREADGEAAPGLLADLAVALDRVGRYGEAAELLREAVEREPDPTARAAMHALLAEGCRASWDAAGALAAVHRGLAELGAPMPRGRLRLLLGALWAALIGTATMLTGIGVVRPDGGPEAARRRERLRLVTLLHSIGGYLGPISLQPELLLVHHLRGVRPAQRLGRSPEQSRALAAAGLVLGVLGLRRLGRGALGRARASAAATGDPQAVAVTAWLEGATAFLAGWDGGQAWARAIDEHDRLLPPGMYADGVASLCWEAVVEGRTAEAVRWYERGLRRFSVAPDAVTAIVTLGVVTRTALGQVAPAAAELARVDALLAGHGSRGLRANLVLARMHALAEQGELGPAVDAAVEEFRALGVAPGATIRQHRPFFVHEAAIRLARCHAARPERLAGRLAEARQAVRTLESVAASPFLAACATLARADLTTLEGDPARALELTHRIRPLTPDAPVVAFETCRVRARALRALGHPEDARRAAAAAQAVARQQGWAMRARWVAREFGVTDGQSGSSSGFGVTPAPAPGGLERSRLAALEEVSRAAARVLDPRELAGKVLDVTVRTLGAERAVLFLEAAPGGDGALVPYLGRDAAGQDLAEVAAWSSSVVERVRATGEPEVLTGTDEGEALGAESVVLHGLRSVLAAPLRAEGRMLGVVYLDSQLASGVFTADDAGLLTALTTSIATSLETARAAQLELSVQAARQQSELAERLRLAFTAMASTEPEEVLARLVDSAHDLLPSDVAWLLLPAGNGRLELVGALEPGESGGPGDRPRRVVESDPVTARLIAAGGPVAGAGVLRGGDPRGAPVAVAASLFPAGSWLSLPLETRAATVGVLVLGARDPAAFGPGQVQVGQVLVGQGMTAYVNAELFQRVRELSVVDDLTGIANRRRFFELAERDLATAVRHDREVVAMMIDIDRFKQVNDTFGHAAGDEVIRAVAERLAKGLRAGDVLGRYGGEEFALLLPDADGRPGLPERLRQAVADVPVPTSAGPLRVTVSIGVAVLADGDDVAGLLARADEALYRAKNSGRDRVEHALTR